MAIKKNTARTAVKKGGAGKTPVSSAGNGGRRLVVAFFLLLAVILLGGIIFLVCFIPGQMMCNNDRFKLKQVEIIGSGYWNNSKKLDLIGKLGFNIGENIFKLNAGKIRQKARNTINNIEDAEVSFILPDMVVFRIKERIPVAQVELSDRESNDSWVADDKGKLFKKSESSANKRNLPLITGDTGNQKMLTAALKLISTANREYKDIRIAEVIIEKSHLNALIIYGTDMTRYEILLPEDGDFKDLLHKLQNIIVQSYLRNMNINKPIDLRFRNQATMKM